AFVRFPLTSGPWANKADIVIWTTTPWTRVSNALVAVGPEITYVVASKDGERSVVVGEEVMEKVLGEGWTVAARLQGRDLAGWTYQRPVDVMEQPGQAWFIVEEDYVTTGEGTGLVHQAMAFGEVDYASCARHGIEFVNPIGADGHFDSALDLVGGQFFKSADAAVLDYLRDKGLLLGTLVHEHPYPHCWRCATPLLYYAQPSWYIKTTAIKDQLIEQNEKTAWHPETIKHGRFGDWLNNNVDWALSRKRYWGTPLPIWRNDLDEKKLICVGSRKELGELAGMDLLELDPHRPYVDDITFQIPGEAGTYRRVPEVCDAWFDSGSMPFAQWGYPWVEGSVEKVQAMFPADFIAEAIDQTRGWFYTMLAMGVLTFEQSSYRNVLCLGHILAEDGRKMSKHLGNILLPIPLMDEHGADALRWFMAAGGSPWAARRVGHQALQEIVRKVILTYWNTVAFQALYARANEWSPTSLAEPTHVLDCWLTSATNRLVREVTEAFEGYDTLRAGALLNEYVDELSNWYVRRSRRRFWDGDQGALSTLHRSLVVVTQLMAPMMPFVTERVWQDLVVAALPEAQPSVHLSDWPTATAACDPELEQAMSLTRRIVELGRAARAESKMKTRQPLARLLISSQSYEQLAGVAGGALLREIEAELNIELVESFAGAGDLVEYSAKGNFRALGKRFGKDTPTIAAAIAAADAALLAEQLRATGKATVNGIEVLAEEVLVSERPREGWSVVSEGETVALDLELTAELKMAGLAREAVRMIQEARKSSGFEVSDRIELQWQGSAEMVDAFTTHQQLIADEVLATSVTRTDAATAFVDDELGLKISVAKA
ncbi:MAG: class I tRNA ligase family protein, partial [Propionibacteriaceae bacterium]